MRKFFKIIALILASIGLVTSCDRRNIEYLVLDDFIKSDVDGALLGSISIVDEIRHVDLGYLLYVSGEQNKEEHYFYFDRTFIVNKFEGPYKLNSYPYQNKIDDICSFIVEKLDVKSGFELINKLIFKIDYAKLYENNESSGYLVYDNTYRINENNYDLSLVVEE